MVQQCWFSLKIVAGNNFKSFIKKAKLLENTESDVSNESLKNTTIVVPFLKSFEMLFINCKFKLEHK